MKTPCFLRYLALMVGLLAAGHTARAQSTIDTTLAYGWAANIGWTNWRASAASGAVVGEYVCSGYVYSANVGWINLGSGKPADGIYYENSNAADFGINYFPGPSGSGLLRGYAYGANIGWIYFEDKGDPRVNLRNGQLYGYAYSANCGWINLGSNTTQVVKTLSITPGVDTDGDGIADAYELNYFGSLNVLSANGDYDHDGFTDLQEYLDGTDATNPGDGLRIISVARVSSGNNPVTLNLTFSTVSTRVYRVESSPTLVNPTWTDVGLGNIVSNDYTYTVQVSSTATAQFFRVRALRLGL